MTMVYRNQMNIFLKLLSNNLYLLIMKCLIIFAGESFRMGGQYSRNIGSDESFQPQYKAAESHIKFINSLIKKEITYDLFINTYETPFYNDLIKWYSNLNSFYIKNDHNIKNNLQNLFNEVLNIKRNTLDSYDFILCARIDMCFKDYFIEQFNPLWEKIMFPSICFIPYHTTINNEPRVNDTMIFIPKKLFSVIPNFNINHYSWYNYKKYCNMTNDNLDLILSTYHDSDTAKDWNPLYYLVGRNMKDESEWVCKNYSIDKVNFTHVINN